MRRLVTLALLALVALSACATPIATPDAELVGSDWQLIAMTTKSPDFEGNIPAEDQARYAITFGADGLYSATADCNMMSGEFKTVGSKITIKTGASTLAMCPEDSLGGIYAAALTQASTFDIVAERLTITLVGGGSLVFEVAPAATPTPSPTPSPTPIPTIRPIPSGLINTPTPAPVTPAPTAEPTKEPTAEPTAEPTKEPTPIPTIKPLPSGLISTPTPAP